MACVEKIMTRESEIVGILNSLYTAVRVGGAWLMFLSRPMFHSAIFSTYEVLCKYKEGIMENMPENATLYAIYFLTRAAMKMHSVEVSANKKVRWFIPRSGVADSQCPSLVPSTTATPLSRLPHLTAYLLLRYKR